MSLAFYQHLFSETLFVLPEEQERPAPPPPPTEQGQPQEGKPPVPVGEKKPAPPSFVVQGANRRGLVLLVRLPEAAFKALPDLDFLQKLLKAIHHGPDEVAFVNALTKGPVSLAELKAAVTVTNLISFGCAVIPDPPIAPPPYTPTPTDGARLLLAEEIAVIVNSQEKKVQLWNALKQMFLS